LAWRSFQVAIRRLAHSIQAGLTIGSGARIAANVAVMLATVRRGIDA